VPAATKTVLRWDGARSLDTALLAMQDSAPLTCPIHLPCTPWIAANGTQVPPCLSHPCPVASCCPNEARLATPRASQQEGAIDHHYILQSQRTTPRQPSLGYSLTAALAARQRRREACGSACAPARGCICHLTYAGAKQLALLTASQAGSSAR
jgi:hypothetical protein